MTQDFQPTIRLSSGFSRLPRPPLRAIALTPGELLTLARAIEREADGARADRRDFAAEALDRRAADLREAARW